MKYARVVMTRVIETWDDNGWDITPYDVFVDSIAAQFEPCPEYVEPGYHKINGEWVAPEEPVPVDQNPAPYGAPSEAQPPVVEEENK